MKRVLKITAVGEQRKKKLKGQIRLEGRWLVASGMIPEGHVVVTCPRKGVLVLRMQ